MDTVARNFLEAEVKQNMKKKSKVTLLTLVKVLLAAEPEYRQLKDLSQADFGRVRENISSFAMEQVNN